MFALIYYNFDDQKYFKVLFSGICSDVDTYWSVILKRGELEGKTVNLLVSLCYLY